MIPYAWLTGFVMDRHQNMVSALMVGSDQLVVAFIALYFLTVSRYWLGILLVQTVLSALALLYVLAMCPESPKWLLSKGKRQEAIVCLNRVAEVNKSDIRLDESVHFAESRPLCSRNESEETSTTWKLNLNLFIMCTMFMFLNLAYFMARFMSSAFEGYKLYANLSFGTAEFCSALFCGLICKYISQKGILVGGLVIVLLSQLVFFFVLGGTFTSTLSLVSNFTSVFALGVVYAVFFVVIQSRVPVSELGKSLNMASAAMFIGAVLG